MADLTAQNLKILVEDMGGEPGHHASADLYRWYVGMAAEAKLAPISHKAFGASLKILGYQDSTIRKDGKATRCWFLTHRAWRGDPPREDPT